MSATSGAEAIELVTGDGITLEGQLARPTDVAAAAVLAHPHPLNGGDMDSTVIDALFRDLPEHGIAALRFNFRGVGRSGGSHGRGIDERHDLQAAIEALVDRVPGHAPWLVGWSFGADVSLQVDDERVAGWVLIAPPLAVVPPEAWAAAADARPKRLLVPEHDQFRPPDGARQATGGWVDTEVEVVADADHFLVGHTAEVARRTAALLLP